MLTQGNDVEIDALAARGWNQSAISRRTAETARRSASIWPPARCRPGNGRRVAWSRSGDMSPRGFVDDPGLPAVTPLDELAAAGFGGNPTNIKNFLGTATAPASDRRPSTSRTMLGGSAVSKWFSHRPADDARRTSPKPRNPRQQMRSARALCRTRTDDPFLTMEVLYQLS
jgi:hypothetical protein